MSTAKKRKSFDNFAGWTDEKIDDWIKERKRLDRKQKHLEQKIEEIRMTHRKRCEDTTKVRYLYLKENQLDLSGYYCGLCSQMYQAVFGPGVSVWKQCPRCHPASSMTLLANTFHFGVRGSHTADVPGEGSFVNPPVRGSAEDCLACILSR